MSDSAFGTLVTTIAIVIMAIILGIMFGPGHNLFLECSNYIYMSFNSCRLVLGL